MFFTFLYTFKLFYYFLALCPYEAKQPKTGIHGYSDIKTAGVFMRLELQYPDGSRKMSNFPSSVNPHWKE